MTRLLRDDPATPSRLLDVAEPTLEPRHIVQQRDKIGLTAERVGEVGAAPRADPCLVVMIAGHDRTSSTVPFGKTRHDPYWTMTTSERDRSRSANCVACEAKSNTIEM